MAAADTLEPPLDTARHIRYWQRCFRSVLPHHYTSNDSIRLTLGTFIISALDLLSASTPDAPIITSADRTSLRAWILNLQHPHGGFCGSPHHVLPRRYTTAFDWEKEVEVARDPANANIAATYFAVLALGILAEGDGATAYDGIDRARTLRWLKKLQRKDGSFGEIVTGDGSVAGGRDMRYCYLAATIRWALGGAEGGGAHDFDVDALVGHIRRAQAFDGGIAESSTHESQSGYAYCAVASLALLDRANPDPFAPPDHYVRTGIPSIPALVHFLVHRQVAYLDSGSDEDEDDDDSPNHPLPDLASLSSPDPPAPRVSGFNGRPNKLVDTCYVWWNAAALTLLGQGGLIDLEPVRRFLIEKTQHLIGGFAKHPGGPPDVYHAYMGLAALGTMAGDAVEPGLGKFDPRLCAGADVAGKILKAREALIATSQDD